MSPGIDTNDFNVKVSNAQKFLNDGNRVKVSVRFRGREMAHTDIGEKLLMDFAASCAEVADMDKNPKLEGRFMAMFLSPKTANNATRYTDYGRRTSYAQAENPQRCEEEIQPDQDR